MRSSPLRSIGLLFGTLALFGCASGGGGGGEAPHTIQENLSRVLQQPFEEGLDKVWSRYQIPERRRESQFRSLYYESQWMEREPTPAEVAQGATAARNRVTVQGRRVGDTLDGQGIFSLTWEVENQIRSQEVPEWHPGPMPEQVRDRFRRMYSDLRMEVNTGVRR